MFSLQNRLQRGTDLEKYLVISILFLLSYQLCFSFKSCSDLFLVWNKSIGHVRVAFQLPLCQNESNCEVNHMDMCSVVMFIVMQIKLIFIRKVLHGDSFWNGGRKAIRKCLLNRQAYLSYTVKLTSVWFNMLIMTMPSFISGLASPWEAKSCSWKQCGDVQEISHWRLARYSDQIFWTYRPLASSGTGEKYLQYNRIIV